MSDKAILICACSGMCPSMKEINFWDLSERIRNEGVKGETEEKVKTSLYQTKEMK